MITIERHNSCSKAIDQNACGLQFNDFDDTVTADFIRLALSDKQPNEEQDDDENTLIERNADRIKPTPKPKFEPYMRQERPQNNHHLQYPEYTPGQASVTTAGYEQNNNLQLLKNETALLYTATPALHRLDVPYYCSGNSTKSSTSPYNDSLHSPNFQLPDYTSIQTGDYSSDFIALTANCPNDFNIYEPNMQHLDIGTNCCNTNFSLSKCQTSEIRREYSTVDHSDSVGWNSLPSSELMFDDDKIMVDDLFRNVLHPTGIECPETCELLLKMLENDHVQANKQNTRRNKITLSLGMNVCPRSTTSTSTSPNIKNIHRRSPVSTTGPTFVKYRTIEPKQQDANQSLQTVDPIKLFLLAKMDYIKLKEVWIRIMMLNKKKFIRTNHKHQTLLIYVLHEQPFSIEKIYAIIHRMKKIKHSLRMSRIPIQCPLYTAAVYCNSEPLIAQYVAQTMKELGEQLDQKYDEKRTIFEILKELGSNYEHVLSSLVEMFDKTK